MFRCASTKVQPLSVVNKSTKINSRLIASSTSGTPTLPESADVVIIGGGSSGCNTLYQLTKRGVKAVLLERAKATSGTTWHSSGIVWRLRPNDVDVQILASSRELFMRLESETGMDPGWINNGALFIAHNQLRLDEYRRLATMGRCFGIESHILDPKETQKLYPLLDPSVIVGSLYSPGDGTIDPSMLCATLIKASTKSGGKVFEDCPVSQIQTGKNVFGSKKVTGVVTPYGTIKTNCVVNCGGVWAREVAALVGLTIPLVPMKHAYILTESIEGARGLPNIRDHDASIFLRPQGESLCLGGYENNPIIQDNVAEDFQFSLYDLDWSVFGKHVEEAVRLIPAFETAGIKKTICGSESFTTDHKPIMGEDPRLFGFYHNCGYNSAGMMLGGGCGEQLAKWIIQGRPDFPMYNYDIRRYTADQCDNAKWSYDRTHECYANNFSIVFPHDEPLAGRNLRQDPFHQDLIDAGAVMEERQGWERPGWYLTKGTAPVPEYDWYGAYGKPLNKDSHYINLLKQEYTFGFSKHHDIIGEEALACREQVALFNMSYFGKMYLSGPDAQKAADWLFTADTNKPIGNTVYSCLLNKKAGVEGYAAVSAIETGTGGQAEPDFKGRGFYIVTSGSSAYQTLAHIQSAISQKPFNVQLTDLVDKVGVLSIQGPNSRALLQQIIDVDLSDQNFPFSTTQLVKVAGHVCRALRLSFVGELGWELHVPWDSCQAVLKAVVEQGNKHGLRHAGYRSLYSLSSEKGNHIWHADLRSNDNPTEAGLSFTCRSKGDYLGKEAFENAQNQRPQKRLGFFQFKDQVPVLGLETIFRDDTPVGFLRRGEYGYALGSSIGQGYVSDPNGEGVSIKFFNSGSYEVEVMGKRYEAKLHLKSPFDPLHKRLMGNYEDPIPIRQ